MHETYTHDTASQSPGSHVEEALEKAIINIVLQFLWVNSTTSLSTFEMSIQIVPARAVSGDCWKRSKVIRCMRTWRCSWRTRRVSSTRLAFFDESKTRQQKSRIRSLKNYPDQKCLFYQLLVWRDHDVIMIFSQFQVSRWVNGAGSTLRRS